MSHKYITLFIVVIFTQSIAASVSARCLLPGHRIESVKGIPPLIFQCTRSQVEAMVGGAMAEEDDTACTMNNLIGAEQDSHNGYKCCDCREVSNLWCKYQQAKNELVLAKAEYSQHLVNWRDEAQKYAYKCALEENPWIAVNERYRKCLHDTLINLIPLELFLPNPIDTIVQGYGAVTTAMLAKECALDILNSPTILDVCVDRIINSTDRLSFNYKRRISNAETLVSAYKTDFDRYWKDQDCLNAISCSRYFKYNMQYNCSFTRQSPIINPTQ